MPTYRFAERYRICASLQQSFSQMVTWSVIVGELCVGYSILPAFASHCLERKGFMQGMPQNGLAPFT